MALVEYYGTGRRKTSTARVHIRPGSGAITVNRRTLDNYFGNEVLKMIIKQPLSLTETVDKFDIVVTVDGGGPSGQAGAIRHGISRALQVYTSTSQRLKKAGLLPRDPRMKEAEGLPEGRSRALPVLPRYPWSLFYRLFTKGRAIPLSCFQHVFRHHYEKGDHLSALSL